jgi:mRNA interferase RelE/StbE
MYEVIYSRDAKRALARMPRNTASTIQLKIEALAVDPYAQNNNATKLQGRAGYRLRVGDWRVVYEIVDERLVIHVVRIAARGSAYEK